MIDFKSMLQAIICNTFLSSGDSTALIGFNPHHRDIVPLFMASQHPVGLRFDLMQGSPEPDPGEMSEARK